MKRKLTSEVDREMVIAQIKKLDLGKTYTVEITQKIAKRTISQNSLYWGWLTCISVETGQDKDDIHQFFKHKFLTPEKVLIFNQYQHRYSTANLNTAQYKYLLDHVQAFANSELGINLPDPDDKRFEEFYKYYIDRL